ncbi:MAG: lamin tail domain-containing protein [Chloroflexi bacterium]|nr:lamin tail domain-containing protein [Chloroflexota bacterium]
MRARGFFIFVVLNVLITAGVAFAVVSMLGPAPTETSTSPERFATVLLIITATPDPNTTPIVRVITATPEPGTIAAIPTGVLDPQNTTVAAAPGSTESAQTAPTSVPTIDPALAGDPNAQATISALPPGCILHVLADGESPGRLAEIYDTDVFAILEVNGLTEDDARFLQIGQTLVVPLEGCALLGTTPIPGGNDDSTEATATLAPGVTPEPTLTPTVTLAPTAENAQVEVDEVLGAGDITSEHLVIINRGATVNLTGWTLSDLDGNVYTFPETRLFNDGLLEVWTQVGENTPLRRYWGLTRPVWGDPGDVITLEDATGAVQATLRISGD